MGKAYDRRGSAGDTPPVRRALWRRRRILVPLAALLALVLVAGWMTRSPAPVGHWDGADGRERFMRAYQTAFQDMPEVAETFDLRTDYGIVRAYRFAGNPDGTPTVLLPGRSSASPVWADNMGALLDIGDVYTVDLLGEPGMSVQDRPISSDEDQAAWLRQVLEQLPEDGFHMVGLSIGGWAAVNLVLHHPEAVEALSLIDPVFVFDDLPLGTVLRTIPAAFAWMPKSWRDSFTSYTAGGAPVEDVPVAEMIEAGMQHYALRLPQPTRIHEDRLEGIEVPVLAIIAGESVMLDPETAVATAQRSLPRGTVRLYEGASHAVNGEHPEEIARDIAEFLTAQDKTR
ncbi:alpha/beta fold hydrolase [Sediminivirga luteola]|uniref:alpha/beta fold hydrolase n=1 Tax=Sediminivirga luteola TaxID=1774748 RepID=UPI001F5778E4|nr:alpha/beta hydrolase [Sediminivirga luteola]MCI2264947.1 alpha/beta hydrolase [Sediminivirga luteola]